MPFIYNATADEVVTKCFGNFHKFKPKAIKSVGQDLADFISENRKELGLVVLPKEFEEEETGGLNQAYYASEAGKAKLGELELQGINNLIAHHRQIIHYNQVSLRKDLSRADEKADPLIYASETNLEGWSTLKSMELVSRYQKEKMDADQKKIDKAQELLKKIGPL